MCVTFLTLLKISHMYNDWFICAFDHRYFKCKKGTCGDVSYCIIVNVLRHCVVCCNTELVKAPYGSHWPFQGGNQNLMAIMSILIQDLITQQNHVMFYVFAVYTCLWYCSVCFLHFMWATLSFCTKTLLCPHGLQHIFYLDISSTCIMNCLEY